MADQVENVTSNGYVSSSSSSSSSPTREGAQDKSPPKTMEEKLVVAVRVRPLKENEGDRILHIFDEKTVVLEDSDGDKNDILRQKRGNERKYMYDMAFGEDSTQEQVYNATTKGLVRDVLVGYNATVFAYGATGSGKTHTMVGDSTQPGIMVRALNDLFHSIDKLGQKYSVSLSYLEIYNENIRDLLNPSSGFLDLREDTNRARNITIAGLTEVSANSTQEVMDLLQRGNKERTIEPTAANKTSSRSHALLSVTVRKSSQVEGQAKFRTRTRQGKLYMLDLAGSERASQTKNRGKRLLEGAHINRSLLALGNVINSLSGGGSRYVNYRDSKLTRLLREALSGNCRTVMIAHASPASLHKEESKNTLVYAARANGISHKVERNVLDVSFHVSQYRNIISDLRTEISRLRRKLTEDRPSSADLRNGGSNTRQVNMIRELIVSTFREQMKLRRRLMDIDGHLLSLGVEAERQHQIISQWESRNNKLYHSKKESRPSTTSTDINDVWGESNEINMHQAWSELSYIEREQERYVSLRSATLKDLDESRQRSVMLENELPLKVDSETEREMLSLLCRVHELEADKMALQGERLVETHELRRRGELLQRFHRQQKITDDIITRQRQLMEDGKVDLPKDLQELYKLYQQEIHATTYNTDTAGLPYTAYDSLPPITKENNVLFEASSRVTTAVNRNAENDLVLRTPTSGSNGSSEWDTSLPPLKTSKNNKKSNKNRMSPPSPVLFPPISNNFKT